MTFVVNILKMFYYYKQAKTPTLPLLPSGMTIIRRIPQQFVCNMQKMQIGKKRWYYFQVMTFLYRGFSRVFEEYDLIVDRKIVSKAVLISRVPIYSFLPLRGLHLCYCETAIDERGKGYYPLLLSYIQNVRPGNDLYMIVDGTNTASIRGVEKAGFIKYAEGRKTNKGAFVIDNYV